MKNKKIIEINNLKSKISLNKSKRKKIILCHGVFDLIHVGHIKYLQKAKSEGDFLLVSITSDAYVNKGFGRPLFNQNYRAEVLASLDVVDAVYINNSATAVNLINIIKPDIYFKGPDYKNVKKDKTKNILKEIQAVKKSGGKISFSNDITFSSSNLINANYDIFNKNQKIFINKIKRNYNFEHISKKIDYFKNLKICLVGETIVDQYVFGEVLGKSGKEPHLVINEKKKENYLGGAAAIANHLSSFCNSIDFLSVVGEKKEFLPFIKKNLKKNIITKFINKKKSTTILKKRFIDHIAKTKLLGVYELNDNNLIKKQELELTKNINKLTSSRDMLIISDYGHGLISEKIAKHLMKKKIFISLNAQVNASNQGYHSLRKYKNINVLVINENELRHEMRDKTADIEKISNTLMKIYNIQKLVVTRGSYGALLIKKNSKPIYCPAFASKIIDKVGAGDAMLAIISLCFKMKLPDDLSLFISSLAGAIVVENVGNSKFVDKSLILRQIEYILK
jgi:rfaE bifunctional protein kinase chain/domain/rfaE bifunctional protein nucleotidyltransferase chain/domain